MPSTSTVVCNKHNCYTDLAFIWAKTSTLCKSRVYPAACLPAKHLVSASAQVQGAEHSPQPPKGAALRRESIPHANRVLLQRGCFFGSCCWKSNYGLQVFKSIFYFKHDGGRELLQSIYRKQVLQTLRYVILSQGGVRTPWKRCTLPHVREGHSSCLTRKGQVSSLHLAGLI